MSIAAEIPAETPGVQLPWNNAQAWALAGPSAGLLLTFLPWHRRLAGLKAEKGDPAWYMPGVQIIQVVPWHLRLRTILFPRLVSEAQVYPGDKSCAEVVSRMAGLCKGLLYAGLQGFLMHLDHI